MKTTNMNNNANTPAITEIKYISNYKEIRNEDGGSRINIQATLCNSVDVALSSYMFSVWGDVLVTNITTGEECVYNHLELKAWCSTLTLDELANYHMRRVRDYGESSHIAEYYFTVINEADKVDDEKNPLWKLEVCNVDTGELIESRCFSSIRNMVEYADTHLLNWRYPRSGKVNCAFYVNGYNITKHFEAQSRKNYTLDTDSGWNNVLYVTVPIEECASTEETVENAAETYICSICGKEHSVQSGRFNPWPVRMPVTVDGERNYCCTSCYEQYVSTMYKFMFTVSFLHGVDEKFNKYPENQEGYIRMLSGMTTEELDSLVEEEHLREQNVMFCLRFLEANRAKAEKKRLKEEERKARARERLVNAALLQRQQSWQGRKPSKNPKHTILYIQKGKLIMKTTNMNNANAAIENAVSEFIYVATRVRTEVWEERIEMDISAFECADMAAITGIFTGNNELVYVVKNLATGEETTCDSDAVREWCMTQTLDSIADYRIACTVVWDRLYLHGRGEITHEVYFTRVKRSDVPEEIEHPLWLLEVSNADTNEVVAHNWYETPGAMLNWVDERILDWRYTEAGVVNHTFRANGVDITKRFYAKDRKRYTLSVDSWDTKRIHITIDTYQYSSLAKKGKKKFVCSICGEEHLMEEGTFLPHPVRPNKDSDGRYNYCCATCYEKYVGPMQACRWEIGTLWTKIKELEFWGHTYSKEDMFYEMTIAEMDSIIKQGNLRKNAMYLLRYYEPNRDAEKVGRQLRDRGQARRWKAQQAVKLAELETK